MTKKIVGLCGMIGAGKSTIAQSLISKGFEHLRFSAPLEVEIEHRGLPLERSVYQDIGDEWRRDFGVDHISRLLLDEVEKSDKNLFVIDGFRNPGEIVPFRERNSNFLLIGIYADPELRFERMQKRGLPRDPQDWEAFEQQEKRDLGIEQPEFGQNNLEVFNLADILVINRGSLEQTKKEVENILHVKGII